MNTLSYAIWLVISLGCLQPSFAMEIEEKSSEETLEAKPLESISQFFLKDIWSEIASYLDGNTQFLNELARQVELGNDSYDNIVKSYIDTFTNYPMKEDIPAILQKGDFKTSTFANNLYQQKIKEAFERYINLPLFYSA